MVTLYVAGQKVGNWAEAELLFRDTAKTQAVEFRDENGLAFATTVPVHKPIIPWEPELTREELELRKAETGLSFEEVKQQLGWQ